MISILCAFVPIACCGAQSLSSHTVPIGDYYAKITVPRGIAFCIARTGPHPHGVFWNIDGSDCHKNGPNSTARSLGIWADYNSSFVATTKKYLEEYCDGSRVQVAAKNLSIDNLESFYCVHSIPKAQIGIEAGSARGIWSRASSDPSDRTPMIYYRVWLVTDSKHREVDTRKFERFISSIKLDSVTELQ